MQSEDILHAAARPSEFKAEIVIDRPPNFEAIAAVFPGARGDGIIFAYGTKIFNPSGTPLPPEIIQHELVHCERQVAQGVEVWWDQYLIDGDFRYEEELLAHRAEYQTLCARYPERKNRRRALEHVAKKLAAPLYGRMVTVNQAKCALKREGDDE